MDQTLGQRVGMQVRHLFQESEAIDDPSRTGDPCHPQSGGIVLLNVPTVRIGVPGSAAARGPARRDVAEVQIGLVGQDGTPALPQRSAGSGAGQRQVWSRKGSGDSA